MNAKNIDFFERDRLDLLFENHINDKKILYVHGKTGFGKTTTILRFLDKKQTEYCYLSADEDDFFELLQSEETANSSVIVIDDLSYITEDYEQEQISAFIAKSKSNFVIISGVDVPAFLTPYFITGQMSVISEIELAFTRPELVELLEQKQILLSDEEIDEMLSKCHNLPLVIAFAVIYIKKGFSADEVYERTKQDYFSYLDFALYRKLTDTQRNYLHDLSCVKEFREKLAIMLTGMQNIEEKLHEIVDFEHIFTFEKPDLFRFSNSEMYEYFLHKQKQKCAKEYTLQLYQKVALYYELDGDYKEAMHYYSLGENTDKLSALLIENTKRNPLAARYHEVEQYYFRLSNEQISSSPELMCGMSMLHSIRFSPEQSEFWYEKLAQFSRGLDKRDGRSKIAKDKLLFLDIALPHRGTKNAFEAIKTAAASLLGKKISPQDFSATGDMPSLINGGLDFSHWTKNDKFMYATIKKPLELVLGKSAVGLMDTGFAENLFERAVDLNFTESLTYLNSALSEVTLNGTKQMEFATIGVMSRIFVASDSMASAKRLLEGYLDNIRGNPTLTMQHNVEAMLTLFALYCGENKVAYKWLEETAPNELFAFYIIKRLQYLVKVRVYILKERYMEALSLLDKLKIYFESYHRPYGAMQTALLRSVIHYRIGDEIWQKELSDVLLRCEEYKFIRIVADEGMAILEPLLKLNYNGDNEYYKNLVAMTRKQALIYPSYLVKEQTETEPLTEMEQNVLRLMMQGMTNEKIGELLGITLRTVKFHTGNIYSKMNVKNRAEAIIRAKEDNIFRRKL